QLAISVLSVILLGLLGAICEALPNLFHLQYADWELPASTEFFVEYYPLNAGYFIYSLTPLMAILLAAPFLGRTERQERTYKYVFVITWLVAWIYIAVFILAFLAPHILSMTLVSKTTIIIITATIDCLIILALVALGIKQHRQN
ncbi:MAG: hypothetical protein JW709_04990, partial [Sedimentisphaerales bacterium]|nr:hypothetical protein [Sedimentisphaerales bacterium]